MHFTKLVIFLLDKNDLTKIIWIKSYKLLGDYLPSVVEFKGEYYFIVQHFQQFNRAALVKANFKGEIKIKEIKGFKQRPEVVVAGDKLFLVSALGPGPTADEDEIFIAEIDPDNLEIKWAKSYGKFTGGRKVSLYDEEKKEIIVLGKYIKEGVYFPVMEILRINLKGEIIQEKRYYFGKEFYPKVALCETDRYLFFGECGMDQIVFAVNRNNLDPLFIKTLGIAWTDVNEGLIKVIKDGNKYLLAFGANLAGIYSSPRDIVVARLNTEFKVTNNDFYWLTDLPLISAEEIDLAKSTIKETPNAKQVKLVEIPVIPASFGSFKIIESEDKKDLKIKIDVRQRYRIKTLWYGEGKLEPMNPLVEEGGNQIIKITPKENWVIKEMIVDGRKIDPVDYYEFNNVDSDHEILVRFGMKEHKVIIKFFPYDSGQSREITTLYDSNITINIIPYPCYYVKDIVVDGDSKGVVEEFIVNVVRDVEIQVFCERFKYQIVTGANNGGKIEPENPEVLCGYSQTFLIKPDKGYRIKDVLVDGKSVGTVNSYTFKEITENHTIEVIFEKLTYQINASAGAGGTISPSGKIEVKYGDSQTFAITPDKGYRIKDVLVDGKSVGAVTSYTFKNIESDHLIEAIFEKEQIVIKLQIGSKTIYVNGIPQQIDVAPQIVEGRTLLPIRYIAEPLGATVNWDGIERKVTVSLENTENTVIELWIGKNIARVNGNYKFIDPNNPKVVPLIISGRTMLPVRFIAENLGCQVDWDSITKTITITYP